jgi:hypothetical protein
MKSAGELCLVSTLRKKADPGRKKRKEEEVAANVLLKRKGTRKARGKDPG